MKFCIIALTLLLSAQAMADEPRKAWVLMMSYKTITNFAVYTSEEVCKKSKALAKTKATSAECIPFLLQ